MKPHFAGKGKGMHVDGGRGGIRPERGAQLPTDSAEEPKFETESVVSNRVWFAPGVGTIQTATTTLAKTPRVKIGLLTVGTTDEMVTTHGSGKSTLVSYEIW